MNKKELKMEKEICSDLKQESFKLKQYIQVSDKSLIAVQSFLIDQCFNSKNLTFMRLLKQYDQLTYYHCIAVALLTNLVCNRLPLKGEQTQKIVIGALLHDIGKIRIPKEILNKPGALTKKEYEIMKHHVWFGYQLLQEDLEIDQVTKEIVLCHHEKEDGTGYPFGYKKDQLDQSVKIVALCDFYHALIADRCYRKGLPVQVVDQMAKNEALNEEIRLCFESFLYF